MNMPSFQSGKDHCLKTKDDGKNQTNVKTNIIKMKTIYLKNFQAI